MASSWSRITPRFTPETRLKVEGQDKVPMGLQEPQWINVISSVTYFGEARWLGLDYENLLTASIREATGSAPKEFQLLDAISNYGSPLAEGEKTYNAIACNELFDHSHLKLKYANGNVTDTSQIRCEPTNLQPYDSARWQMRLRTVYVMGEDDPSTSFESQLYHFRHQINDNKLVIQVEGGGHLPLQINLRDCLPQIYSSAADNHELSKALQACSAKTQMHFEFAP